jgi:hypothetical protein
MFTDVHLKFKRWAASRYSEITILSFGAFREIFICMQMTEAQIWPLNYIVWRKNMLSIVPRLLSYVAL